MEYIFSNRCIRAWLCERTCPARARLSEETNVPSGVTPLTAPREVLSTSISRQAAIHHPLVCTKSHQEQTRVRQSTQRHLLSIFGMNLGGSKVAPTAGIQNHGTKRLIQCAPPMANHGKRCGTLDQKETIFWTTLRWWVTTTVAMLDGFCCTTVLPIPRR